MARETGTGKTAKAGKAGAKAKGAPTKRRGEGKDKILRAALQLFADYGFDAVSTADIAKTAGSSQSVVLYHFNTKDELWRAAIRLLFDLIDVRQKFDDSMYKDLDPLSRLRILLRGFILTSARHPELGRIIFREGTTGGDRLNWLVEELARPNYQVFDTLFREAVEAKLIKPYPPTMLTLFAHGAAATIFNLSALSQMLIGSDPYSPEIIEMQSDMVVDILLNGVLLK